MTQCNDFLGRQVAIGGTVVYPTRRGSGMWLCQGKVKDIRINGSTWLLDVMVQSDKGKRIARGIPAYRCVVTA